MTWKTTATLLLSVPELLAPLARYAARERVYPFCYWNERRFPAAKIFPAGVYIPMRSRNFLPQFHLTAPLERRITHESLSLLTPDGATTSSLQPGGESWSVLRARFDPWLVAEAEKKVSNASPVRR